jgi:hypothetical protein
MVAPIMVAITGVVGTAVAAIVVLIGECRRRGAGQRCRER